MQETKTFKPEDIKTQGRLTAEEIKALIDAYEGKAAPCDHKYKPYTPIDVPKVNLYEFISDLRDVLKAGNKNNARNQQRA